ncbi:MAG TPA: GDSL-type esterase/lipase family protein [Nocardioides sp.]
MNVPLVRRVATGGLAMAALTGLLVYEAVRVEASTHGVPTVFIGDSISQADTDGFTDLPGKGSWLRYVVVDDRTPWRYVANTAVSGQTLGQMEARFRRDVLSRDPAAVVIMGGTNDVRLDVPIPDSLRSLRAMVTDAQATGADVWVISPPPLDRDDWGDVGPLIAAERELAAELGVPFVETVPAVGAGGEDRWRPGLASDGAHPTRDGARAIAAAVLDAVATPG